MQAGDGTVVIGRPAGAGSAAHGGEPAAAGGKVCAEVTAA